MTKRSQLHERYRKGAEIGSTRRSAARAKPARRIGTIEVSSAAGKGAKGSKGRSGGAKTPSASSAIKRWRTIWWAMLVLALACVASVVVVPGFRDSRQLASFATAASAAFLTAALYIELVVIRKLRQQPVKGKRKPGPSADVKSKAGTGRKSGRGDAGENPSGARAAGQGKTPPESEDCGAQEKE